MSLKFLRHRNTAWLIYHVPWLYNSSYPFWTFKNSKKINRKSFHNAVFLLFNQYLSMLSAHSWSSQPQPLHCELVMSLQDRRRNMTSVD